MFFLDQNLSGQVLPEVISKASGCPCLKHNENFALDARDIDWLPLVGARGWILVTKDRGILERPIERQALLAANVRAFVFKEGNLKREVMAAILTLAMPEMLSAIAAFKAPFVFNLQTGGKLVALSPLIEVAAPS